EFSGELAHIDLIPSRIEEAEFDLEEEIRHVENLLYDNSTPRPSKELNAEIADTILESLSPSPILVEDSDSHMEEINLFLATDDLMPPGIKYDDYNSEGDIHFLEEFLSDDPLPLLENESFNFDHLDDPSFPRPSPKPPDVDVFFDFEPDTGVLTTKVVKAIFKHYVLMPNLLPTLPTLDPDLDFMPSHDSLGSRNKIFELGIFIKVQSERLFSREEFSISFIRDPLYPVFDTLLPFSSKNEDKVCKPGIPSYLLASHQDKITSDFTKNPMMILLELSFIPGIVHRYMDQRMNEAIKILIEKMESNKSIHQTDEQRNLYKALLEAYKSDKIILDTYGDIVTLKRHRDDDTDKDEEPSAGSDWGSKRRKEGNEPESTSAPKEKVTRTTGKSTQGSKSQQKTASESAPAEEPMQTTQYFEERSHQEFETSVVANQPMRVEDLQLGVESYQKKINLTNPDTYRSDLKRKEAYSAYSNLRGFIYQNTDKQNRLMRIDELHKFSAGTLNDVRTALDDRLKGIRMKYLPQSI
nr:hypothetical protein [Tanacetum cinerariifolium]